MLYSLISTGGTIFEHFPGPQSCAHRNLLDKKNISLGQLLRLRYKNQKANLIMSSSLVQESKRILVFWFGKCDHWLLWRLRCYIHLSCLWRQVALSKPLLFSWHSCSSISVLSGGLEFSTFVLAFWSITKRLFQLHLLITPSTWTAYNWRFVWKFILTHILLWFCSCISLPLVTSHGMAFHAILSSYSGST